MAIKYVIHIAAVARMSPAATCWWQHVSGGGRLPMESFRIMRTCWLANRLIRTCRPRDGSRLLPEMHA